jgi:uncharacterized protein YcbX
MRTVARLSITPVKSMALQHPEQLRLERLGVPENRRFYVADRAGRLLDSVACGRLMGIRPTYDPQAERLTLEFPGGATVEGEVDELGEPVETNFWGRPVDGHEVPGPWTDALSDHVGFRVRLVRTDRPGDGVDSHAASLFSSASAEELDRHAGTTDRPLDRRRWRMLVEVAGCRPHEEDDWTGRRVRLGGAVIEVVRPDPRCRVTTLDPDTGQKEFDTLRVLARYRRTVLGQDLPFGVYADVAEPGAIAVGDPVEPLTESGSPPA